jgi:putative oxidoreductase
MIDLAILVLRVALGIMFCMHGLQKCFGLFGGPGVSGFSKMLSGLGLVPSIFWAYVASYTELTAGTLLIIGLFVRSSSVLLLILILVAAYKVHLKNGFFMIQGGIEYVFIIAAVCLALILLGAGKYALLDKF